MQEEGSLVGCIAFGEHHYIMKPLHEVKDFFLCDRHP
jgi:hypothetical protein